MSTSSGRLVVGALAVLAAVLAASQLIGSASASSAIPWPVDITYEVVSHQGETTFTSVHRFAGESWRDWTDEVLKLERSGAVEEDGVLPPGPGSTTTFRLDGTLRTEHWPAFTEEPWDEPFVSEDKVEEGQTLAPGPLLGSARGQTDRASTIEGGARSELAALLGEASEQLDMSPDAFSVASRVDSGPCPPMSDCDGELVQEYEFVFSPDSEIPVAVDLRENGTVTATLRVLSITSAG